VTRLYLRLFIAFWLVVVLTISAVLVVNIQLARLQQDERVDFERAAQLREGLATGAATALAQGGEPGLVRWLETAERRARRLSLYVIDAQGRELAGREVPRAARGLYRRWQRSGALPEGGRRGQFAHALSHQQRDYLLLAYVQPPPALLRVLGPVGPWGLFLLGITISGLVCLWLAWQLSRPIQDMRVAGRALGQGDLAARVPAEHALRRDELGELARDFNSMAERIQQLLANQRQLLRDVSHELRSPLARIQVAMTLARDAAEPSRRDEYLARIEADMERLNALISQILTYSRLTDADEPRQEQVDVHELLEHVSASAELEGAPRHITVTLASRPGLRVSADAELLHSALENVVRNAIRHAPDHSTVEITSEVTAAGESRITVRDQGPGVPDEMLERMFEPFVRLSRERGETSPGGGIGLAIARRAMARHGGQVMAANRPEGGLEVSLTLPAVGA